MGQEIIYSVLTRPTLKPSDLVYRRRVSSADASERSLSATVEDEEKNQETVQSDTHDLTLLADDEDEISVSEYRVDEKV